MKKLNVMNVNRKNKYGKYVCKIVPVLLAVMIMVLNTGCAEDTSTGDTKIVLTTGFAKNEVFRIEKSSCTLPEVMVYLTNTKNQYENTFGDQIWEAAYQGVTLEENIKETVLARLARVKAMNLLAEEEGISLNQQEKDKAAQAASEYYQGLNETERSLLGVNEELIQSMYEEYTLANKVYEYLIADINPEISDDEARTITVEHIFIKTYTLNENGERVDYSDQARQEAYQKAREVLQRAKDGEEFSVLAAEYSDDSNTTYSFGKGTQEPTFEEAAFNLATDEISNIVETEYGYHIIKCISTFDREETDRNKVKIVEQRRQEVFDEEYSSFVEGLTRNMNTKLWGSVCFIDHEEVTTDNFFEIYHSYF